MFQTDKCIKETKKTRQDRAEAGKLGKSYNEESAYGDSLGGPNLYSTRPFVERDADKRTISTGNNSLEKPTMASSDYNSDTKTPASPLTEADKLSMFLNNNKKHLSPQNKHRSANSRSTLPSDPAINTIKAAGKEGQRAKSVTVAQTDNDSPHVEKLQSGIESLSMSDLGHPGREVGAYKNIRWSSLKIKPSLAEVLYNVNYTFPSPVQLLAIPPAIEGKDLLVRARNGSGKTASFIIPILNKIDTSKNLQAVILVPIRELALQISKVIMTLGGGLGIKSLPLVGGVSLADDIMRLSAGGVHVAIGTPGRFYDLLNKKVCSIEDNPILVFDEADKLLDSHFYTSVYELLQILPRKRQTLLFSATFPASIEGFVRQNMQSPLKIKVSDQQLRNVKQYLVRVPEEHKLLCLKSLLDVLDIDQCIIYCNMISSVKKLAEKITSFGMSAYFIHSEMLQVERNIVYHNFSKKKCKMLVSTDITTRGIDVPGVNVVINFDMPSSSESYLHRIGRTGRFGTPGCAINFIVKAESFLPEMYERALGVEILPISHESFKDFCKK